MRSDSDRRADREYDDGRLLLGRMYVYGDRGTEVDVKADKRETIPDRNDGDHQRKYRESISQYRTLA